MASNELASTYAALILADDGLEITVRFCSRVSGDSALQELMSCYVTAV